MDPEDLSGAWLYYVMYIWVSLFGAITTSQFWLLANHAFNPREAKRLFAFIGAGGVLGGIFGGSFTAYGARWFGTEQLLLWCAGFSAISMLLAERVWSEVTPALWDDTKDQPEPGDIPQNGRDVTLAEADFQFQTSHSVDGYLIAHRDHRLLHGLSAQIPLESFLRLQRPAHFLFRISIGV